MTIKDRELRLSFYHLKIKHKLLRIINIFDYKENLEYNKLVKFEFLQQLFIEISFKKGGKFNERN